MKMLLESRCDSDACTNTRQLCLGHLLAGTLTWGEKGVLTAILAFPDLSLGHLLGVSPDRNETAIVLAMLHERGVIELSPEEVAQVEVINQLFDLHDSVQHFYGGSAESEN